MDNGHIDIQSLSIVRSFIRYAVSSIVYHKLSLSTKKKKKDNNDHYSISCSRRERDDKKVETENKKSELKELLTSCFTEKRFCGMNHLQFLDVVDDNDTIKDDNGMY